MKDFSYTAPTSLAEATRLLGQVNGTARLLAGGTDILVQLREGLRDADLVVDIKKIPELMELSFSPAKGLRLGPACLAIVFMTTPTSRRRIPPWSMRPASLVGGKFKAGPASGQLVQLVARGGHNPGLDRAWRDLRNRWQ